MKPIQIFNIVAFISTSVYVYINFMIVMSTGQKIAHLKTVDKNEFEQIAKTSIRNNYEMLLFHICVVIITYLIVIITVNKMMEKKKENI